jgi:anti-sigma factor RsiW
MSTTQKLMEVERWLDEHPDAELPDVLAGDPACAAHAANMRTMRAALAASVSNERIEDAQLPAFMEGIRDGIERPSRGHRGLWAFASVAAAALIVALCVHLVFMAPPSPHAVVEAADTEVEGATANGYISDNGTAVVWVEMDQPRDVL